MRRAANGIVTALRRPGPSFPSYVKEASLPHSHHYLASSTAPEVFNSLPFKATLKGGGSIVVRRCMSSGSAAGTGGVDGSPPSKYMEKEAQIRESQKMVRELYKEGSYQVRACSTDKTMEKVFRNIVPQRVAERDSRPGVEPLPTRPLSDLRV